MPDSDATARVRIIPAAHDLIVEVVLKDGRSTLRRVQEPAALKSTLEALLTVPPAPLHVEPTVPLAPSPLPIVNELPSDRALPVAHSQAPTFGVEAGGGVGGRIAGGQAYLSVAAGGFAQLRAGDWLFGMSARWDVFQTKSDVAVDSFEMETVGAGISVGRRFRAGFGDVDLGVSPRLVAETQSFFRTKSDEVADTQTDVRLAGFARAVFGHSALRLFAEADAELSPGRIRRNIRIDPALPPLPAWSAGVAVGVVWGQP